MIRAGDKVCDCGRSNTTHLAEDCPLNPATAVMRGDLVEATTMLAADNARLCEIGLAADKLAGAVEMLIEGEQRQPAYTRWRMQIVQGALDAYKTARNGQ